MINTSHQVKSIIVNVLRKIRRGIMNFKKVIKFKEWYPSDFKKIIKKDIIYNSLAHNSISFLCPCGCGAIETIKKDSGTQIPNVNWKFTISDHKVTIHPSMYMRECKTNSHYWLRDSTVQWV